MDRRRFCAAVGVLSAPALAVGSDGAYPSRPIRIISAYAAGGGPDVQLRQAGPLIGDALAQSIVVENRVGAGGFVAAQFVAHQPADGYMLLMGSNTHLIQKAMQPSLAFDPVADFAPISNLVSSPTVLVVNASGPYRKLDDLIADAKARPGQLNYSSGGLGTSAHLAGATLVSVAGLKATHIPLKGSVEIAASLLRDETQFAFPVAGTAIPHVKGGKLRALAVTSRTRLKELPDVPTLLELLKSDLTVQESWFGLWAPARTPQPVLLTLNAAIRKAASDPALRAAYEAVGNECVPSASPAEFATFVRAESRKWTELVALADAKGT